MNKIWLIVYVLGVSHPAMATEYTETIVVNGILHRSDISGGRDTDGKTWAGLETANGQYARVLCNGPMTNGPELQYTDNSQSTAGQGPDRIASFDSVADCNSTVVAVSAASKANPVEIEVSNSKITKSSKKSQIFLVTPAQQSEEFRY